MVKILFLIDGINDMPCQEFKFIEECLKCGTKELADCYDYFNDRLKSEITTASALKTNSRDFITLKRYGFLEDRKKPRIGRPKWVDISAYSKNKKLKEQA